MARNPLAKLLPLIWLAVAGIATAEPAGQVLAVSGTLMAAKQDGRMRVLAANSAVDAGDTLQTDSTASARIRFADGGSVSLRPDSQLRIDEYRFAAGDPANDKMILALLKGGLRAITGLIGKRSRAEAYSMRAPNATIGIRGTDYGLQHCAAGACAGLKDGSGTALADGLHAEVFDGSIVVGNGAGSVVVAAGGFAYVRDATTAPVTVTDGYRAPREGGVGECVID